MRKTEILMGFDLSKLEFESSHFFYEPQFQVLLRICWTISNFCFSPHLNNKHQRKKNQYSVSTFLELGVYWCICSLWVCNWLFSMMLARLGCNFGLSQYRRPRGLVCLRLRRSEENCATLAHLCVHNSEVFKKVKANVLKKKTLFT